MVNQTDLVVIHSPVGGGHKAAALAVAEEARARGLTVAVLDLFEHAPRVFGDAYVTAAHKVVAEVLGGLGPERPPER